MQQILIIEDDPLMAMTVEKYLQKAGYGVMIADNGKEGVFEAMQHHPHLILCDIMMPEIDGYQVLKMLRENKNTANIPFIFLTSKESKEDFREGMNLGADDYLIKPVKPEQLLEVVALRLSKQVQFKNQVREALYNSQEFLRDKSSHEFNTPLSGIILSTELLLQRYEHFSDEEVKTLLKNVYLSAKRLHNTVQNNLLYQQLLRAEEDEELLKLYSEGVCEYPEDIIEEVVQELGESYERVEDIHWTTAEGSVLISEQNFKKIIKEIFENALKFSEKNTKVLFHTALLPPYYLITIQDFGKGMTESQIETIDAYQQFEREKYEQQGLGLGLYIARKLLKINRGKLEITSSLETGTQVKIYFTLVTSEETTPLYQS